MRAVDGGMRGMCGIDPLHATLNRVDCASGKHLASFSAALLLEELVEAFNELHIPVWGDKKCKSGNKPDHSVMQSGITINRWGRTVDER